jgi:hypothetical protein
MFLPPDRLDGVAVWPAGITVAPLAAEPFLPAALGLSDRSRLTVARLTMAPGRHRLHPAGGPTIVVVESGQAVVTASPGPGGVPADAASPATLLAPGDVTALPVEAAVAVQNVTDAPLDIMLVTLAPTDAAETP